MLTGFFVVFFVEFADQLFKHGTHGVVVDASGRQINVGVEKLVDQRAQGIGLGQGGELVAELEVLDDVQHVGREAVEVVLKIGQQLLRVAARLQVAQGEAGSVVKSLARRVAQGSALLGNTSVVQHFLGIEHALFGGFEHRVHAPDDEHGQDDIGVLAALEQVAQHIVCNAPDEGDDFVDG